MSKPRLDQILVRKGLVTSRSQAENYIKLGYVWVEGHQEKKPGTFINSDAQIQLRMAEQYVSRAALKLDSVASTLGINFEGKTVLDVGSSTGGFTDYALRHGASRVIAVDVGSKQLHPSLHGHPLIELHENTDIRNFNFSQDGAGPVDIVLIDVSFISLREVLPHILDLVPKAAQVVVMVKPQFEAGARDLNKGVIKNDRLRRQILKDFEDWVKGSYKIGGKADSEVAGSKGNVERFYSLAPL